MIRRIRAASTRRRILRRARSLQVLGSTRCTANGQSRDHHSREARTVGAPGRRGLPEEPRFRFAGVGGRRRAREERRLSPDFHGDREGRLERECIPERSRTSSTEYRRCRIINGTFVHSYRPILMMLRRILVCFVLLLLASALLGQSRGGRRRPGTGNPEELFVPWKFLLKGADLVQGPL